MEACNQPCPGNRAKFISTILWLAATYVLADVYSAQLTSQLARPAREAPISFSFEHFYWFNFYIFIFRYTVSFRKCNEIQRISTVCGTTKFFLKYT